MTRKTKILLFRWSLFATLVFAAFWGVWYAIAGSVPAFRDDFGFWPIGSVQLPFAISRWWDIALAGPFALACWQFAQWAIKTSNDARESLGNNGPIIPMLFGTAVLLGMLGATEDYVGAAAFAHVICATVPLSLLAASCRKPGVALHHLFITPIVAGAIAFLVLGGPLALYWALTALAGAGIGLGAGRLFHRFGIPLLLRLDDWLGGDAIPEETVKTVETPVVPEPTPHPLADYDRVVRELEALDAEEGRIPARRRDLEQRLGTLCTDPEIAKRVALRAERPAA